MTTSAMITSKINVPGYITSVGDKYITSIGDWMNNKKKTKQNVTQFKKKKTLQKYGFYAECTLRLCHSTLIFYINLYIVQGIY